MILTNYWLFSINSDTIPCLAELKFWSLQPAIFCTGSTGSVWVWAKARLCDPGPVQAWQRPYLHYPISSHRVPEICRYICQESSVGHANAGNPHWDRTFPSGEQRCLLWPQIGSDGTNLRHSKISFLILKSPRFVPFSVNLSQFEVKTDMPAGD